MSGLDTTHVGLVVDELVTAADRLGLRWRLRPATVATPAASGASMAVLDGDTIPIKVIPLAGSVAIGDRVMVAIVPPSGHYVIGWAGPPPWEALDSLAITTAGTYYDGTAEALVTSASVSGPLVAGRRYRIMVGCPLTCATAAHTGRIRIRLTNLAGAEIGVKQHTIPGANYGETVFLWGDYTPAASGIATFVVTCQRVVGATSNVKIVVAAGYPITMSLTELARPSAMRTI